MADPNLDWGTPHLHWIMGKLQCIMGSGNGREFPPFSKATDSPLAQPSWQANASHEGCARVDCEMVYWLTEDKGKAHTFVLGLDQNYRKTSNIRRTNHHI